MKRTSRFAAILVALILSAFARNFVMPRLVPATTMAARDPHPQEKLTLGADPYDTPEKASLFHPKHAGSTPFFPSLSSSPTMATRPLSSATSTSSSSPATAPRPNPIRSMTCNASSPTSALPGSRTRGQASHPLARQNKAHGGLPQKDRDELEHASFAARAVEPHSLQQGFLFFDVGDLEDPAKGARLFVTGVNDARGHELMYFEVPLGKP